MHNYYQVILLITSKYYHQLKFQIEQDEFLYKHYIVSEDNKKIKNII